jgi:hypothetical protein
MKTVIRIKKWLFSPLFQEKKLKFQIKQLFRHLCEYFDQNFERLN